MVIIRCLITGLVISISMMIVKLVQYILFFRNESKIKNTIYPVQWGQWLFFIIFVALILFTIFYNLKDLLVGFIVLDVFFGVSWIYLFLYSNQKIYMETESSFLYRNIFFRTKRYDIKDCNKILRKNVTSIKLYFGNTIIKIDRIWKGFDSFKEWLSHN